ncbi:diaminopimelate decarboxylase [Lutispora saccharofermentans]|uniref:Diaminopimelate decarboxylase n=1 Tax=Lutispora saccharofermentans TaxID=3024236 RepID=A0ABT1NK28_9FIRM|nr:diaminopimelate decarboxylase [Lutispora saccharofermentans]MCQ1531625.1 diaminopimelate decarboxylase [Lutispora saccharofermentans]
MNKMKQTNNYMFAGYDTVELAKKYGTPLYVLSEESIRSRCKEISTDFLGKYENSKAVYASKAFLTMTMCKIIESEGLGLDVVSGGELYTAIKAGFPMDRIMFHGNNKSYDELEMAINNEVGRIVVDHIDELYFIEEIGARMDKTVKILIRVAPGVEGHTHKYITTGQKDSKFGIPLDKVTIDEAVSKAIASKHIELMGFHFHIGSNLFENDSYVAAVKTIMNLYKRLKDDFNFVAKELNTGGGFGIYYTEKDCVKPLKYFTDAIMKAIYDCCQELDLDMPGVIIEPGRWIVGEAGITLYTVGAVKEIPGIRTYASVDGGLPDNPRPALYSAEYKAVVANKYGLKPDRLATIAGRCCETGDILIWDLEVPEIKRGDILAVLSTGAYNYSMANNYNRIPRPAVLLLSKDGEKVIVERETYEDLLRKEVVPF